MDEIIKAIDEEIKRLQQARKLLAQPNRTYVEKAVAPQKSHRRRKMSAEARAKIAAAQKRRWAKQRTKEKKTAARF